MTSRAMYLSCLLILPAAAWAGGEVWDRKPPAEWSAKDCERMLDASPWVRRDASLLPRKPPLPGQQGAIDPRGGPDAEGGERSPANPADGNVGRPNLVYFRWSSSQLIRQAMVRSKQLQGTITEAQAKQSLESPAMPRSLVLSVTADSPQPLMMLLRGKEESIRTQSYLEKKNRQRIPPERVVPMDPQKGAMDLLLVFPRELNGNPTLALEDQEVELVFIVGDKKIKQKYRLDRMTKSGKLDL